MRCLCAECPLRPAAEIAALQAKKAAAKPEDVDKEEDLKDEIADSDKEEAADNDAEGEEVEQDPPEEEIIVESGGKRDHIRELWTGRSNNLMGRAHAFRA